MEKKIKPAASKKIISWSFILSACLLLYGCPYSSSYKLDTEPNVLADDVFIGKWSTIISTANGQQPLGLTVTKKDNYEYNLCFTGRINGLRNISVMKNDSLKATAFFSEAASRRFLNIGIQGQNYIAEFLYKNDKITILPLCEHFTTRMIKTDAELKTALESHYKTRLYPLYDEEFSIRELIRVKDAAE